MKKEYIADSKLYKAVNSKLRTSETQEKLPKKMPLKESKSSITPTNASKKSSKPLS